MAKLQKPEVFNLAFTLQLQSQAFVYSHLAFLHVVPWIGELEYFLHWKNYKIILEE